MIEGARSLHARLNHAKHRHRRASAKLIKRPRRGRVAGEHHSLHTHRNKCIEGLSAKAPHFSGCACAIRHSRCITEVNHALMGELSGELGGDI
jgi:hypothetical protein